MSEQNPTIQGIVRHKRDLGGLIFFEIDTAPETVTVIARKDDTTPTLYQQLKKVDIHDFCQFEITVEKDDRLIRRLLTHLEKQTGFSWSPRRREILRAYSFILHTLREFLVNNHYTEVRLPAVHFGKSDGDIFELDYFGNIARLTSSNSLFLDVYTLQLQKAFSLQKCFRAEKSRTSRHLSEFDMLEAAALNHSLTHSMETLEELVKHLLHKFRDSPFSPLSPLDFARLQETPFKVIQYREVARQYPVGDNGLGKYEREIAGDAPVFIIDFPRKIASWTARPIDQTYSRSFNLLLPGVGEAAQGTEKQTDMQAFRKKLKAAGMEKQLHWYIQMTPYSNHLLSGFGLGVERVAMWIMGLQNIRDIHPIYRDTGFSELNPQDK